MNWQQDEYMAKVHTVKVIGQGTGLAVKGPRSFAGLAKVMTRLARELVVLKKRFRRAVGIPGHPAHHGVGVQHQTLFTLETLGGLRTLTTGTGLVALYGVKAHDFNSVEMTRICS